MPDKQLQAETRAHRPSENVCLLESKGFDQPGGIVRHLRDGRVICLRLGGHAHAAVVEEDQLVLLGEFFDHRGIPQAHGGHKPVDQEERFALAALLQRRRVFRAAETDMAATGIWRRATPRRGAIAFTVTRIA